MRIYFMGICGTAMGNAALLVREQGHDVCGSDSGIYPPMSDVLADAEIQVFDGYDANRMAKLKPDRVVVGNVISRGNVEVEWLLNQSEVEFISLPQLFHDTVLVGRCPVVITGTHGKTTTSSMAAFLLNESGAEPGWLIGGVPRDLPSGAKLGSGKPFVLEGDEYDTAFFDKRSKFIHYRPKIAVLNNLEFDHADIFRDLQDVKRTFNHFLRIIPSEGFAIINGDDENLKELLPVPWTQVIKVGTGRDNDLQIANFNDDKSGSSFDLIWKGVQWSQVNYSLHGLFNARNAAMAGLAAAFASSLESPLDFDLSAFSRFKGVQRRQDELYRGSRCIVLEDFGHHPTAIAATIEGIRAAYPYRELVAVFEPRSSTACTSVFQKAFADALVLADRVYIGAVHRVEKIAAGKRLDTKKMAGILSEKGCVTTAFESNEALMEELQAQALLIEGAVLLFFTNGSFDGVQHKTAALFREVENSFKSDITNC